MQSGQFHHVHTMKSEGEKKGIYIHTTRIYSTTRDNNNNQHEKTASKKNNHYQKSIERCDIINILIYVIYVSTKHQDITLIQPNIFLQKETATKPAVSKNLNPNEKTFENDL